MKGSKFKKSKERGKKSAILCSVSQLEEKG